MSQATIFMAAMMFLVARLGGSHLTREARERTVRMFATLMHETGITHLFAVADIRGKHIRQYVFARLSAGAAMRTIHNELAHLRGILRAAGCYDLANAKELSNMALGLGGTSRKGTKVALTADEYERVRLLARTSNRPGLAALLRLMRTFGLRANEAIHARTDTLERWAMEILTGSITVLAGTKGGKTRVVPALDKDGAAAAINEALNVAKMQGGFLVVRNDGSACGGLKHARAIVHDWFHRAGIQPHSARYAYAQDLLAQLIARGLQQREALIVVALALGHGDGRGRYMRLVYGFSPAKNGENSTT